jgi:hypothetical protein
MSSNSRFTIHSEAGDALNTFVGLASDNPFPVGSTYEGVVVHSVSSVIDETPTTEEIYAARQQRNTLLVASDWTQVADAPVDQAAWATYRQELRDITNQEAFPSDVTWPVAPQ